MLADKLLHMLTKLTIASEREREINRRRAKGAGNIKYENKRGKAYRVCSLVVSPSLENCCKLQLTKQSGNWMRAAIFVIARHLQWLQNAMASGKCSQMRCICSLTRTHIAHPCAQCVCVCANQRKWYILLFTLSERTKKYQQRQQQQQQQTATMTMTTTS